MTENEIVFLVYGLALGANGMSILNTFWARRDARRAREASAAALHRAAGDVFYSTFRAYRLQQRIEARR
ncbi:hypothetical protein ACWEPI_08450 [Streptomyces sp. NPDC004262]